MPRMNTKYRRTQQWLKDAPGSDDDITLARAAFLSRATTLASTIPSVYSPETDHASPASEDSHSTERLGVNGLGLEYDDASDVLSAAEMAKAARGRHKGDEVIKVLASVSHCPLPLCHCLTRTPRFRTPQHKLLSHPFKGQNTRSLSYPPKSCLLRWKRICSFRKGPSPHLRPGARHTLPPPPRYPVGDKTTRR